MGIISACAEQTVASAIDDGLHGDHLRVCGADSPSYSTLLKFRGSSPRVRSRLKLDTAKIPAGGIISACAEQTDREGVNSRHRQDHLRVCGADRVSP